MAQSDSEHQDVVVDGRRIRLTNLQKVLYPETGTTKRDVIDYYAHVAGALIPYSSHRPVTRKRWVHGVGTADAPGETFFQKNIDERSTPTWVARQQVQHSDHTNTYPLLNDLATLTWLAQMAALEIHVPQWRFGPDGLARNPDRLVLDLDPGPGMTLAECAEVARLARVILRDMGLDPMPVTSGSKGIHLYAALDGRQTAAQVSNVAHELSRALEADHPDLVVSDMKKSLRDGRILVDWSQNSGNKTTVAPYSLRGRTRPTVAAPRTWRELAGKDLRQLEYQEVVRRVAAGRDPLSGSLFPASGPLAAGDRSAPTDRLQKYRSMRDGAKTPEPVPHRSPGSSDGRSFVIQEHHARKLHWDFRLEHDGVLVSWALPKGVPTDAAKNHLAVQTEDHPLEYALFAGSIPAGEYGAGKVTVWDSGTYELEKWRDGKEVIVTVHGQTHGSHRYALIHTGNDEDNARNWLIHLMRDSSAPDTRADTSNSPMLATAGSARDFANGTGWYFEMKWDGIRIIADIRSDRVRLASRNGVDVTSRYPELLVLTQSVSTDAVLDGEVVALNPEGRPDFGTLQGRMHLTDPREITRGRRLTPVYFMVFDVLSLGGVNLTSRPYWERRGLLEAAVKPNAIVQVPPTVGDDVDAALTSSLELGLEGVVGKAADSVYTQGERSRSWIKVKHQKTQDVVIGGWRPGQGNRADRIGALLLGIPEPSAGRAESGWLRYVGRVGTGFTEKQLDEVLERLHLLETEDTPFIELTGADAIGSRFVTPSLVGEVSFAGWTSGGKLRQPTWRGLRTDRSAADVAQEA